MSFLLEIDGRDVQTEKTFHEAVTRASGIDWYGQNLDALWDLLTGLVEAPIEVRWSSAALSRTAMGEDFVAIVAVIREAEERYRSEWPDQVFKFELIES